MKIGLLGGSFDPPHFGHIFLCHYALETTEIQKLLVIPCLNHPFNKKLSDYEHRFNMCGLAFAVFGKSVEVNDIEKKLGGVSYTINTIKYLKNSYPDNQYFLLIGSDILKDARKWKDFEKIQSLVNIKVFHRIGEKIPDGVTDMIQATLPATSSELIRSLVKKNESIKYLTSDAVIEYINRNKLYRSK